MRNPLLIWIMPLALFVCGHPAWAQDAANTVVITIATVKESDWQHERAQETNPVGLRQRLQARTLVELSGELRNDEEELVLRSGKARDIVTEWAITPDRNGVVAKKMLPEFIGTEIKVVNKTLDLDPNRATRLSISLTHDLQPPQMQPMTYATAATGVERDEKSVTAPRFNRLRWQGEVLACKDERLITSFTLEKDASMRIAVFIQGTLQGSRGNPPPPTTLRQTIYRVPEMDMIEWLMNGPQSDAALEKRLQEAVAAGQASVVSNLSTTTSLNAPTQAQAGDECCVPKEVDQDLDRLYQLPVSFATVQAGTRLEGDIGGPQAAWKSHYAPCPPLAVKWPTSWLRVHDRAQGKSTGKAIHGWMDWYDRFEETTLGEVAFHDASPHLISMMPPADQTWGTERKGRWLDVTIAQRQLGGDRQPGKSQALSPDEAKQPADPFAPDPISPAQQPSFAPATPPPLLMLGIALDSDQAQALLTTRQQGKDEDLLRELVSQVKTGKAQVVACSASANQFQNGRKTQVSARMHAYPTEMPSIPSAWNERTVGTRLEQEGGNVALQQDLAPPARTEWKLARDMPEAIMWEPRFRSLFLNSETSAFTQSGTYLCAVTNIPAVISGGDIPEHETVFLFAQRSAKGPAPKTASGDFEVETLIFEIPAKDAKEWQAVKSDDLMAFTQQNLKQGAATLQSYTMQRTQASVRSTLNVTEEYMTATEFDPPNRDAPYRMRPTALMTLPVGLQLKVEVIASPNGTSQLGISLKHSTARPVEPGLEETLQIYTSGKDVYPGAKHEFDEWTEKIRIIPGKFHCLLSPSHGGGVVTTRIAFVRVHPIP
ncbi:hypothetical protein [Prosthecobacter sp.]|uniref:hypothetical protein n=1 Tax=Prosthecobacter sp. TaxID=1965333 RepID=UPI00248A65CB|nr:hypothetical protein [Prosthecobacter sp.]MDI1314923.1 hypothetical protein [Prosthecobacter sp.]